MAFFKSILHFLGNIFKAHKVAEETGKTLTVNEATDKAIEYLAKAEIWIDSPEVQLLETLTGDKVDAIIEVAKTEIPTIINELNVIHTIPDIAVGLQDYRFAKDDKRNKLLHDVVTTIAYVLGGEIQAPGILLLLNTILHDTQAN